MLTLFRQTRVPDFWTDDKELLRETKPRMWAFLVTGIQHTRSDRNINETLV
jgi:hypothetical protein